MEGLMMVFVNVYRGGMRIANFDNFGKNVTRKWFQPMFIRGFCVSGEADFNDIRFIA
jgi:hypothetical protein